jgi:hypothetical protein
MLLNGVIKEVSMNFIMSFLQDVVPSPDILSQLTIWLTPLIVFAATWLVKKIGPNITGATTVAIIVPVLTAIVSFISYELNLSVGNVMLQIVLGLLSVFVNEFIKQVKQENPTPPSA